MKGKFQNFASHIHVFFKHAIYFAVILPSNVIHYNLFLGSDWFNNYTKYILRIHDTVHLERNLISLNYEIAEDAIIRLI